MIPVDNPKRPTVIALECVELKMDCRRCLINKSIHHNRITGCKVPDAVMQYMEAGSITKDEEFIAKRNIYIPPPITL